MVRHDQAVTVSPDDYLWFTEGYPLGLNFCVTLVRGLTPDEVIARLGGAEAVDITGAHRLGAAAGQVDYPDRTDEDGSFNADLTTGLDFIAATGADGWTSRTGSGAPRRSPLGGCQRAVSWCRSTSTRTPIRFCGGPATATPC